MGKFEKLGFRNLGLRVIESINWVRLYGLNNGFKLFLSTLTKKHSSFFANASFLKVPFELRDNKSDKAIFFQVFYEKQYDLYGVDFPYAKRIIDGGANIGCASVYFSMRFPEAKIIAIEPEKNNFELLKKNVAFYKNIQCLQAGIWDKNEKLSLTNPEGGAAEFMFDNNSNLDNTINGITIPAIIDSQNWDDVDILKLDIEGAEKEVFTSSDLSWLKKVKLLIIELHDRYKEGCTKTVFEALNQFNYDAHFHHENIFIFFK
ncbi:MAG: FkbM family methyltransferase [Parafilimonas sp.]